MKAVVMAAHGGPEVLRYGDAPDPVAAPGEVVVDIHAATVNAADYRVRLGGSYGKVNFPHILGRDFSGVVSVLGEGVSDLKMYLRAGAARLDKDTRARLEQIVEAHRAMAELEERRQTAALQSQTYRERIDELNAQLVSLRKVTQAQALSRNLAQKMDDISQRLQKLTIQVADLDGQLLAERVKLQDRLAELTLVKPDTVVAAK